MSVKKIIEELITKKITLHIKDGNIKIKGAKDAITAEVLNKIKENKAALINYLESTEIDSQKIPSNGHAKSTNENIPDNKDIRPLEFGLFYFGNSDNELDGYRLLLEGAKYADKNNYTCVWTPERHFHEFGGLYPSPSVLGSAVAAITEKIDIRAGSVVIPLHNPIRIAEEWSVIDNLSGGRVGIACASGWQANDFVLSPESWSDRHKLMYEKIETVNKLWQGQSIELKDGNDFLKETQIFPKPIQKTLPLWLTSGGNIDTFITAGKLGMKVLTHMLGTTLEELEPKIQAYRKAYKEGNHQEGGDKVVIMLHTFIDENIDKVHQKARKPFINYLRTSVDLIKNLALSMGHDANLENVTKEDLETMLDYAFTRYTTEASLIGTVDSRLSFLKKLSVAGIDEIAALIDFGVDSDAVLENLKYLTELKNAYNAEPVNC